MTKYGYDIETKMQSANSIKFESSCFLRLKCQCMIMIFTTKKKQNRILTSATAFARDGCDFFVFPRLKRTLKRQRDATIRTKSESTYRGP